MNDLTGLNAIQAELRRLQANGQSTIALSDDTMSLLRDMKLRPSLATSSNSISDGLPELPNPIRVSQKEDLEKTNPFSVPAEPTVTGTTKAEQLGNLEKAVGECPVCLSQLNSGGQIVFGEGDPDADIFFCGEAPGADEERIGRPFVGKAGQLLDKIISAMGLQRESVYIANILKWRPRHDKPYGNRPPNQDEMNFCLPYVRAQLQIVSPKVIVALGNTAVAGLLGPDPQRKITKVRGTFSEFEGTPVMITFHPSYLLRNGTMRTKRMVWEDMMEVMKRCEIPISETQKRFFIKGS